MEPRVGPGGDNVDQVIIKLGATSKERALNKLLDNTGSGVNGTTGMPGRDGSNNGYKGPTTFNQYTSNGVTNQYSSNVNQLSLGVIAYDDSASGLAQPTTGIGLFGAGVEEGVYDAGADVVWYEVPGSTPSAPSFGDGFMLNTAVTPTSAHISPALDIDNRLGEGLCVYGVIRYHNNPGSPHFPSVGIQGWDINYPRVGVTPRWSSFIPIGTSGGSSDFKNLQFTSSNAVCLASKGTADYVDATTGWVFNSFSSGKETASGVITESGLYEWCKVKNLVSGSYQYYDGVNYRLKGTSTWNWNKFGGPTGSSQTTLTTLAYNTGVWNIVYDSAIAPSGLQFWWKPDDDTTNFNLVTTISAAAFGITGLWGVTGFTIDPVTGAIYILYNDHPASVSNPDGDMYMATVTTAGVLSINPTIFVGSDIKPYANFVLEVTPTGKILIVGSTADAGSGTNVTNYNGAWGQVVQSQRWWLYDPTTLLIVASGIFGTGGKYNATVSNTGIVPNFNVADVQYVGVFGTNYRYIVFHANPDGVQYAIIDVPA